MNQKKTKLKKNKKKNKQNKNEQKQKKKKQKKKKQKNNEEKKKKKQQTVALCDGVVVGLAGLVLLLDLALHHLAVDLGAESADGKLSRNSAREKMVCVCVCVWKPKTNKKKKRRGGLTLGSTGNS